MMGRKLIVALIVLGTLTAGLVHPPPARAAIDDSLKQSLIISGATVGALALITLIAIMASSDDDEPDFLAEAPRRDAEHGGIRFGLQPNRPCPRAGGNVSLVCW
jgi:hypothetical protein